jgi:PIN domain nuclease of toxin-antitoxin system
MRFLLDTHAFLWWVSEDARLSKAARGAIGDGANECYFSMASAWELAIKVSLGKFTVAGRLDRLLPEQIAANGFEMLHVEVDHVARVASLPFHHRDPFDRLLAAQALSEDLAIVSADLVFRRYGVRRVW